jgi:hypothetical protein
VEKPEKKVNPNIRGVARPGSVPPKLPKRKRSGPLILFCFLAIILVAGLKMRFDREPPTRPIRTGAFTTETPLADRTTAPEPEPIEFPGPRADRPHFSTPGGVFTDEIVVELRAESPVAQIHFTVDGSEPTADSPEYTEPFPITRTTMVKARSIEPDLAPSVTSVQTYTKLDPALAEFTSNLPLVIVNAFGKQITKNQHAFASIRFIESGEERNSLTSDANFDGHARIKYRGFSSLRQPKRSYSVKLLAPGSSKALEAPILGLPGESEWILYAPYSDKTLMRDVLAYELSNKMGRYAARTRFVELFIVNRQEEQLTRRHYAGVYVLVERIKRGPNRVNISPLSPDDNSEPHITGGYIFKRDHMDRPFDVSSSILGPRTPGEYNETGFATSRGLRLLYVEPKEQDLTRAQKEWLTRYMNQFEKALYGWKFKSPTEGYAKFLDVDSFLDQFWLVELSKNIDAFRYSCFMTKDRGGKLKMEPIWDWNLSFGNANYHEGWRTENWYWPLLRDNEICWYKRLAQDPDFVQKQADRWFELREDIFAPENLLRRIDELAELLAEAQERNFERWPILGRHVNPNKYVGQTYEDEVRWMKSWIKKRITWIDSQMAQE